VDVDVHAHRLEEARHDVDLNVVLADCPYELEHLLVPVSGERNYHAVDAVSTDDLADVFRGPKDRQITEITPSLLGRVVDEADQIDPIFRMLQELPANELTDVSGPHDQRVLHVRGLAARQPACD